MAYKILDDGRLSMWDIERPTMEGKIFIELISRWGMVAARPDHEDSAGRQKLALQRPQELVDRAEEVTVMACNVLRTRCWVEDLPDSEEVGKHTNNKIAELRYLIERMEKLTGRSENDRG